MSQHVASIAHRNWLRLGAAILCTAIGTLVGISRHPVYVGLAILGMLAYTVFAAVSVRQPLIFVMVFLFALEIFPPFYFPQSGETPIFISFFLLPIVAVIFIARFADMQFSWDPVGIGLALFVGGTAFSLPFAWWLSGPAVGKDGFSRWLLLSHGVLIYYLIRGCSR